MILLSKLPQHYNFVVQDFLHNTEMSGLDIQKIGNAVVAAWDAAQSGKLPQPLGRGNASKLSNVKRKFLTPTFQNQQQQPEPSGSRQQGWKKTRRGKRGGKA